MENASKALIMAATILIGVMIISILGYAFNMFARYSEEKYNQIEDVQIDRYDPRNDISNLDIEDSVKNLCIKYLTEVMES